MSYASQADLSNDRDFLERVAACAAVEVPVQNGVPPLAWAERNVWLVAASPGFAAAYESAQVALVPRPGRDPAVISDSMILAAVQSLGGA
jgi:hypothetical protein